MASHSWLLFPWKGVRMDFRGVSATPMLLKQTQGTQTGGGKLPKLSRTQRPVPSAGSSPSHAVLWVLLALGISGTPWGLSWGHLPHMACPAPMPPRHMVAGSPL